MKILYCTLSLLLLCSAAVAQQPLTEHTLKAEEGAVLVKASIDEMRWLAGRWVGEGLGGHSEEMWTEPMGGAMLGAYRLVRGGKPVFYEILTIVEHEGGLLLRLKHFHGDLKGWEEKDKTVDFRYLGQREGTYHFSGLAFRPKGDELVIWLALRQKDGSVKEMEFRMRRAPA